MPYMKSKGKRGNAIMSNLMSDEKILTIADEKIKASGKKMTSSQGIFYLRLVKYALEHDISTKSGDGFVVLLSHDEMCYEFHQGKSFVNIALKTFADAGLVERRRLTDNEKVAIFGESKGLGNCMVTKVLKENIFE